MKLKSSLLTISLVLSLVFSVGSVHAKKILAPNFTLKSTDNKNVRLSDFRGRLVLLNFWATWCGPCREEMPILDAIHKKYEKQGFLVLAVNIDKPSKGLAGKKSKVVEKYLRDRPVSFPILLDPTNEVYKLYGVKSMPSTVIIDKDGHVRYVHKGYNSGDEDKYVKKIKSLLRE